MHRRVKGVPGSTQEYDVGQPDRLAEIREENRRIAAANAAKKAVAGLLDQFVQIPEVLVDGKLVPAPVVGNQDKVFGAEPQFTAEYGVVTGRVELPEGNEQ